MRVVNLSGDDWFYEKLYDHVSTVMSIDEIIYKGNSGCQDLMLFRNKFWGKVLTLDGVIQLTETDEFIYHEMIVHVPMMSHNNPRHALVIGGGDGGVVRELLKYNSIVSVTLVEIDSDVIDFTKEYLGSVCGDSFSDPRLHVIVDDGANFVRMSSSKEGFDIAIVDSTDPRGVGEVLFSDDFHSDLKKCLRSGGIAVSQNGVAFCQREQMAKSADIFRSLYGKHSFYSAMVPTYVMGPMMLGFMSDVVEYHSMNIAVLRDRFSRYGIYTKYYTPEMHISSFTLPAYLKGALNITI